MSNEIINPNSSLALTEAMADELRSRDNLSDLPNRVTGFQ